MGRFWASFRTNLQVITSVKNFMTIEQGEAAAEPEITA
jgi:hypothetical protein